MDYKVIINGQLPSWNEQISASARKPQIGGKMKKDCMMIAINAIRLQLGRLKIEKPFTLHYTFYEPNRKRDPGNLLYADKVFCDALQACGVIENDGQKQIKGISMGEVLIDKDKPRIEIDITEIEQ